MLGATLAVSLAVLGLPMSQSQYSDLVITKDTVLTASEVLHRRIIIKADNVTLDGGGLTLSGPGKPGDSKVLEGAGNGITVEHCSNVTIKNISAKGFANGLRMAKCKAVLVENCDFSDNYHNMDHGWGDLPPRGGIILDDVDLGVFRNNKANRVWDAVSLTNSHDNLFISNDFSRTSNTCAKLWTSSRNKFLENNLSYGIRIDRDKGEVHARDSTSVLIESGSDDNYFYKNDITHGGDGIFIRVLNGWISQGNIFVENDTSFANNNCVESWSPRTIYVRNRADRGSYGFWLGGSDHTVLIGNTANFNGLQSGYHNAPEGEIGNGGLVIANFNSSHTLISGNTFIGNSGSGVAFRGDVAGKGAAFKPFNWVIRQNRIEGNKVGIFGRFADSIHLNSNYFANNEKDVQVTETTDLQQADVDEQNLRAPRAEIVGPSMVMVGEEAKFDGSLSTEADGKALTFSWRFGSDASTGSVVTRVFDRPGFYRIALNVSNGALSDSASLDLIVTERVATELGSEHQAKDWTGFQPDSKDGDGGLVLVDDDDAVVGRHSLRFTQKPYLGNLAMGIFPRAKNAGWNLSGKKHLVFWMKARAVSNPGFQGTGPIIKLFSKGGSLQLNPAKDENLFTWLNSNSEARYQWLRIEVPLGGDAMWDRKAEGKFDLTKVDALGIGMDSMGYEPFTVWLDGIRFE
ncbi:MAG: right-handed parallel beta-helix repeat-containing protein [Armatimonadetes bacterium]|nr:right-handed parallel beta-helix repeat-containing protein [Armatimonadota bacterium]